MPGVLNSFEFKIDLTMLCINKYQSSDMFILAGTCPCMLNRDNSCENMSSNIQNNKSCPNLSIYFKKNKMNFFEQKSQNCNNFGKLSKPSQTETSACYALLTVSNSCSTDKS